MPEQSQTDTEGRSLKSSEKSIMTLFLSVGVALLGTVVLLVVEKELSTTAAAAVVLGILGAGAPIVAGLFKERAAQERVREIEAKVDREPEKAKLAWDLARIKLEQYFDRNLTQVTWVFVIAVIVMIVGFSFVIYGVISAVRTPTAVQPSLISALSGIITEFIGLTFMVIYKSTMTQATSYMSVLERINTVGMAVQILDTIPDATPELKNATRAEIAKLLLAADNRAAQTKNPPL